MDKSARLRTHLGRAVTCLEGLPGTRTALEPGWWLTFMGPPDPDMNMALIHDDDAAALATVIGHVEDARVGALVMLAGAGQALADRFPAGWEAVGSMPMMACDIEGAALADDPRVRLAAPDEGPVVAGLAAEAFGMDPAVVTAMIGPAVSGELPLRAWLLEDDGVAVSALMTVPVEDSISVWTMSTPERFARRGYGGALLGAVLHRARADGARIGLLGATPAGYPMYAARGWETVEEWQILTNALSVQFH
jgi:GNAT superfamily N-acetyltransferase